VPPLVGDQVSVQVMRVLLHGDGSPPPLSTPLPFGCQLSDVITSLSLVSAKIQFKTAIYIYASSTGDSSY
jgi:hypothetical protein